MSVQNFVGTYPYTKLDTQNVVSFQTISLLFNSEPPQPPSGAPYYTNTVVYKFKHGYSYIPATWLQWQNDSPSAPGTPSSGNSATTFYAFGDDSNGIELVNDINGLGPVVQPPALIALTEYNNAGSIIQTTQASLITTIDTTYIYISILKETLATISGAVIPLYLAGTTLNIRCYVFTEPANTSTY
jgi:hypothetical protein